MISILIVDDHPLMRKGIRAVLEPHHDIRVIGEASNGLEAVEYARQLQPSVILMDINMPHMDGVQATRLIKLEQPAMTIIGLSVNDALSVRRAMDQAGASTLLSKENVNDDLYDTISRLRADPATSSP
jgi:DNA-binding NarL/FixJ family response regulator